MGVFWCVSCLKSQYPTYFVPTEWRQSFINTKSWNKIAFYKKDSATFSKYDSKVICHAAFEGNEGWIKFMDVKGCLKIYGVLVKFYEK